MNQIEKLENSEMKTICGGSGAVSIDRCFHCSCNNGTNGPYKSEWYRLYLDAKFISDDLQTKCKGGSGLCSKTHYRNCTG